MIGVEGVFIALAFVNLLAIRYVDLPRALLWFWLPLSVLSILLGGIEFVREYLVTYLFFLAPVAIALTITALSPALLVNTLRRFVASRRRPAGDGSVQSVAAERRWDGSGFALATPVLMFSMLTDPRGYQMVALAAVATCIIGARWVRAGPSVRVALTMLVSLVSAVVGYCHPVEGPTPFLAGLVLLLVTHAVAVRRSGAGLRLPRHGWSGPIPALLMAAGALLVVQWLDPGPVPQAGLEPLLVSGPRPVQSPSHDDWLAEEKTLYDIKTDSARRRLFFSDRLTNVVGRVSLDDGSINVSGVLINEDKVGPQQLILTDGGTRVSTFLLGNWVDGTMAVFELDAEELSTTRVLRIGDFIDLVATPIPQLLAGVREFQAYVDWINRESWTWTRQQIPATAPYQILCSAQSRRCYVSAWMFSGVLTELSLDGPGPPFVIRSAFIGPFAMGMAFDESRKLLYVARPTVGAIDVIDTGRLARVRRIPSPPMVRAIACAPEHDLLFVPEYLRGVVHVFQGSTGQLLGRLRSGKWVREILWDAELETLFVAGKNNLYRITFEDLMGTLGLAVSRPPSPQPPTSSAEEQR